MAFLNPETDLGTALAASTVFNPLLVVGTDIKFGPMRSPVENGDAIPGIWLQSYGGQAPEPYLNASADGSYFRSMVQAIIRGGPDDYQGGIALARNVRNALHLKHVAPYVAWFATTSEPLYIGINEARQHEFTVNIRVEWVGV